MHKSSSKISLDFKVENESDNSHSLQSSSSKLNNKIKIGMLNTLSDVEDVN